MIGILCIEGFHGLQIFRSKHSLDWDWMQFEWLTPQVQLAFGILGVVLCFITLCLRYHSYYIVLKENVLGIAENGRQLIIPLESIIHINSINFGYKSGSVWITYQYQGKVKTVGLSDTTMKFFGSKISFLKNFDLLLHELRERKKHVPTQPLTEASEIGSNRTKLFYHLTYSVALICIFLYFA